jgi:type I restriction enzyme S subunit
MNATTPWTEVALLDVCQLDPKAPLMSPLATADYVDFSGIDDLAGEITATRERRVAEIPRAASVFREGDVLFVGITADSWVSVAVGELPTGVGMGPQMTVLRPAPELSARYLWHFFQQPWLRQKASAMNVSTRSQPVVAQTFFRNLRIALPSLEEQLHIVACLDQASVRPFRKAQQQVTHLKQTLTERLMLPSQQNTQADWAFLRLEDMCHIKPKNDERPVKAARDEEQVDFFSRRDLLAQRVSPAVVRHSDIPSPALEVHAGDLLYGGEPDTSDYGRVLVVPASRRRQFAARSMTVLSAHDGVSTRYLATLLSSRWFNHPGANQGFSNERAQTTISRLKRRKLPLPPLAQQHHIVAILDAVPEEAVAHAVLKSQAMYHALAQDAFNGKLTYRGQAPTPAPAVVHVTSDDISAPVEPQPNAAVPFKRAQRRNITRSLSMLQRLVWRAVRQRKHVLIVDDPDSFERFCASPSLGPLKTHVSPNQIRRTLEQITAIGLIQKMNLPPRGQGDNSRYLTAFRSYREGEYGRVAEDTAAADAHMLHSLIFPVKREV